MPLQRCRIHQLHLLDKQSERVIELVNKLGFDASRGEIKIVTVLQKRCFNGRVDGDILSVEYGLAEMRSNLSHTFGLGMIFHDVKRGQSATDRNFAYEETKKKKMLYCISIFNVNSLVHGGAGRSRATPSFGDGRQKRNSISRINISSKALLRCGKGVTSLIVHTRTRTHT